VSDEFQTALDHLPHGTAFRFVDRLTRLVPGQSGAGEYLIRGDEAFLAGHFPGDPIFPGVLLMEAAAQLVGTIAQCDPQIPPLRDLRLAAIRNAKVLGAARPGERLEIEARITGRMGHMVQGAATVRCGPRLLLQADITLSGAPP
jgi:3-hydroxyacyl-[acyl-carrier-protein] dehydratase